LLDELEDYSTDVVETIATLKKAKTPGETIEAGAALIASSENLAEVIAIELIYPFEYREEDIAKKNNGEAPSSIAERRGVPEYYVEIALDESYVAACKALWELLEHHFAKE
jgi:hypothetical protein